MSADRPTSSLNAAAERFTRMECHDALKRLRVALAARQPLPTDLGAFIDEVLAALVGHSTRRRQRDSHIIAAALMLKGDSWNRACLIAEAGRRFRQQGPRVMASAAITGFDLELVAAALNAHIPTTTRGVYNIIRSAISSR